MAEQRDNYEIITNRILSLLEEGTVPWRKPWTEAAGGAGWPTSVRGHRYRGINVFLLAGQAYQSPFWLTFKQALELGGAVRKGEKGTTVVFWKTLRLKDDESGKQKTIPMLRTYTLFNTEQTDGCTFPKAVLARLQPREVGPAPDTIEAVEALVAQMAPRTPDIQWGAGAGRAFYVPSTDVIKLPQRESFNSPEGLYETLVHEIVHASGHPSRLDRFKPAVFGSHTYGREELVAEMGTAFVLGEAGIVGSTIDNHAAYLASWIQTIKEDKRAIVVAAGAAQRAVDYLLDRQAAKAAEEAA